MNNSAAHEVHIFCTSHSRKLRRLCKALPNLRPNRSCDPANIPPGSVCFEYPHGQEREFEEAANLEGLAFEWGGGGLNWSAIFALGDRLYAINDFPELHIYDISDPTTPVSLGGVTLAGTLTALWLCESIAYVTNSDGQLFVININDPTAPSFDAGDTCETGLNISHLRVAGEVAILSGAAAGTVALYDAGQRPAKEMQTLEGTPTIVGSAVALQGRRLIFGDASGAPCSLRSFRIGGFLCFSIESIMLHAVEIAAELIEARHGYFSGDLFANSLTVSDELRTSGIVFVDTSDGTLQRLTIAGGVATVTAL